MIHLTVSNMLVSKVKLEDIKDREECLEMLELCLVDYQKTGDEQFKDLAKMWGDMSQELKQRIDHHDYTESDKRRAKVDDIMRKVIPVR